MKDILILVFSNSFINLLIKSCVTGFVIGFGAEIILSIWGHGIYKILNFFERSYKD